MKTTDWIARAGALLAACMTISNAPAIVWHWSMAGFDSWLSRLLALAWAFLFALLATKPQESTK